ncbi:hypothetical protein C9374_006504 [Naegleria lovaniensis]|uniref:Uncharacterized protein n=1 Tax=Naegleria lovaniensis TaxID=51637 RepID=A0AA88KJG1_NAELO|nr:uncharacterized protein C9374_006504 [Naegleria lovaniensis]KAG2381515.1 hypothetical protein C9374_006504 [Naegleria lovaniensis]
MIVSSPADSVTGNGVRASDVNSAKACHSKLAKNLIFEKVTSLYRGKGEDGNLYETQIESMMDLQMKSVIKECTGVSLLFNPTDIKSYRLALSSESDLLELSKKSQFERVIEEISKLPLMSCQHKVVESLVGKEALLFVERKLQVTTSLIGDYLKETLHNVPNSQGEVTCAKSMNQIFKSLDTMLTKEEKLSLTELIQVIPIGGSLVVVSSDKQQGAVSLFENLVGPHEYVISISWLFIAVMAISGVIMHCINVRVQTALKNQIECVKQEKLQQEIVFNEKEKNLQQNISNLNTNLERKESEIVETKTFYEQQVELEHQKLVEFENKASQIQEQICNENKQLECLLKDQELKVSTLSNSLATLSQERSQIEKEKQQLMKKTEILDSSLKGTIEESTELRDLCNNLRDQLREKHSQLDKAFAKNIELQESIDLYGTELKRMRDVIENVSEQHLKNTTEKLQLEEDYRYLTMEKLSFEQERKDYQVKIEQLVQQQALTEQFIESEKERLQQLFKQLEDEMTRIEKEHLLNVCRMTENKQVIQLDKEATIIAQILNLKKMVSQASLMGGVMMSSPRSPSSRNNFNNATSATLTLRKDRDTNAAESKQHATSTSKEKDMIYTSMPPLRVFSSPRKLQ